MKTIFKFLLSAFAMSVLLVSCDKEEVIIDDNNEIAQTRINDEFPSYLPDEGGGSGQIHTICFSGNSFSIDIEDGDILYRVFYDKDKNPEPCITNIKYVHPKGIKGPPVGSEYKYVLEGLRILSVKFDSNRDVMSFSTIIDYSKFKKNTLHSGTIHWDYYGSYTSSKNFVRR